MALSYGGGQIVQMVSMLVLVRLLSPTDFGIVALAMTLLFVLAHVQETGLGSAIVHLGEDTRLMASSVLVFAALSGAAATLVVIVGAPLYTHLVHTPEATGVVRALGLVLLLRGLMVVPSAVLERDLDFRTRSKAELSSAVVQASVAILCAIAGFGAWSLVAGQLSGASVQLVLLWLLLPWRPSPRGASWAVLRRMMRYGRYVGASNVVNLFNSSIDNFMVGRLLGAKSLGFYALAWRLGEVPNTVIGIVLGRVMFSVYARLQQDLEAVRRAYLGNLQRTVLLALPVTIALGIGAEPIVLTLLGPSWAPSVTPLRILAVFGLVRLLSGPAGDLLRGIGRPQIGLVGAIGFLVLAAAGLVILVPDHGTAGAATAMLIAITVTDFFLMGLTLRAIEMPPGTFLSGLVRPVLASVPLAATLLVVVIAADDLRPGVELIVLLATGACAYALGVVAVARPIVRPIWTALRRA